MDKNIGKNRSKKLSGKYNQKILDHAKQSVTDALKTISKRLIKERADTAGELIRNSIADRIVKVSKTSPQNSRKLLYNSIKMERQKIIQFLDNALNQSSKF